MDEERLIAQYGEDKIKRAKELSERCPVGFYIVEDHEMGKVYYKDTNKENNIIATDYTPEDVRIAYRAFLPGNPHHIQWERWNSELSQYKRDYYAAPGK